MSSVRGQSYAIWVPITLFGLVAVLIGADLVGDWQAGGSSWHLAVELLAVVAAVSGSVYLWWQWRLSRDEAQLLGRDLEVARRDAERWKSEASGLLKGLGEAVSVQFERWGLTPAEAEIALLLLKGLSHKEIADVRSTSERTVRQQSLAVYRKAGLAGRAELSAFFFEDLLLPAGPKG